uniref:Uncharacterized protein n=1 Tax=Arundo donax TaxID=35708 RepID=A0A0A8YE18_ARUDO
MCRMLEGSQCTRFSSHRSSGSS